MTKGDILMIFLKPFIYGRAKTRLAKTVGDQAAMEVYKKLVHHTLSEAYKLPESVSILLCYSEQPNVDNQASGDHKFIVQQGATLGDRMAFAMDWAETAGYQKKIIIGSDCAEISTEILKGAYAQLAQKDIVLGPAKDGGYYLIGLKKPFKGLFEDISWSTETVYDSTVQKVKENGLNFGELASLSDIDNLEDLRNAPLFLRGMHMREKGRPIR